MTGSPPTAASWQGQTLSARYRVERELGRGGMGVVYLARDQKLEMPVVIKAPLARMLQAGGEAAERFKREVRSLVRLSHPHVVRILDADEVDGHPYAVMEYLSGGTLSERRTHRSVSPAMRGWLRDIAQALDYIHAEDCVHRDVKPDNILFDHTGHVYLSDFGIAKFLKASQKGSKETTSLTVFGRVPGTPRYMAPEVAFETGYDGRADQYSLAVLIYELLAGCSPFRSNNAARMQYEKVSGPSPNLQDDVPEAGARLTAMLARALDQEPAQRFRSCREMVEAIFAELPDRSVASSPSVLGNAPTVAGRDQTTPPRSALRNSERSTEDAAPPTQLPTMYVDPIAQDTERSLAEGRDTSTQDSAEQDDDSTDSADEPTVYTLFAAVDFGSGQLIGVEDRRMWRFQAGGWNAWRRDPNRSRTERLLEFIDDKTSAQSLVMVLPSALTYRRRLLMADALENHDNEVHFLNRPTAVAFGYLGQYDRGDAQPILGLFLTRHAIEVSWIERDLDDRSHTQIATASIPSGDIRGAEDSSASQSRELTVRLRSIFGPDIEQCGVMCVDWYPWEEEELGSLRQLQTTLPRIEHAHAQKPGQWLFRGAQLRAAALSGQAPPLQQGIDLSLVNDLLPGRLLIGDQEILPYNTPLPSYRELTFLQLPNPSGAEPRLRIDYQPLVCRPHGEAAAREVVCDQPLRHLELDEETSAELRVDRAGRATINFPEWGNPRRDSERSFPCWNAIELGHTTNIAMPDERYLIVKPPLPELGELVQWEINGVLQFSEPRRVIRVDRFQQDFYVLVEGSGTGIPASEVRPA